MTRPAGLICGQPQIRSAEVRAGWCAGRRERHATPTGAKMHAKIAVADRTTLLVSSANLTTSGIGSNIVAGLVIRGGTTPRRAAEHLQALRDDGHLVRL